MREVNKLEKLYSSTDPLSSKGDQLLKEHKERLEASLRRIADRERREELIADIKEFEKTLDENITYVKPPFGSPYVSSMTKESLKIFKKVGERVILGEIND